MTGSTRTLPEGYVQSGEINLKNNKRLAITLNFAAIPIAILSFFLLSIFAGLVRPSLMNTSGSITAGVVAVVVGLVIMLFTIHELIHGFFFWVFTRSRPVFAIR
ncbi:MAG: hypothetical protein MUO58_03660, partial [Anaerolineales bacterium]|nr:hypothetical protein [Anaerolineales bacterium]